MQADFTDSLHPSRQVIKSYAAYLDDLSAVDVYDGLVGFGMFADKIPPAVSSEPFLDYCHGSHSFGSCWRSWTRFRYMQHFDSYRDFGIPDPFAYELLAAHIRDHWDELKDVIKANTLDDPYVVSRVHVRKIRGSKAIFQMNYENWRVKDDYDPYPALLVGKQYVVHCDISKCFPSIYTHAVDWAIRGKAIAKQARRGNGKGSSWAVKLDKLLSSMTYGETHGLLIGPHASNLVAELILTRIDAAMLREGFRFVRHIDDFTCYAETYEKAESFILKLDRQLQEYDLALNQAKTKIEPLPKSKDAVWVNKLRKYAFPSGELDYIAVSAFLEYAVELMNEYGGDRSALLFAMKMLRGRRLSHKAEQYYLHFGMNLAYVYPYLMPYVENALFDVCNASRDQVKLFLDMMYRRGLDTRDYLTSTYSLYYALRYNVPLDGFLERDAEMLGSEDCLLLLFSWLCVDRWTADKNIRPSDVQRLRAIKDALHDLALKASATAESFDHCRLFAYTALNGQDLRGVTWKGIDDWRALKKANVSFIDHSRLKR